MDFFLSYCNQIFGPRYKSLGFSRHGRLYYKVTNDIVQCFSVNRDTKRGRSCTVSIGLIPLCERADFQGGYFQGDIELGRLVYNKSHYWSYQHNDADRKRVIDELFNLCESHLVDLFQQVTDCNKYYAFMLGYEHRTLHGTLIENQAPKDKLIFYNYLLCIKLGKFEEAIYHLERLIKLNDKNVAANVKFNKEHGVPDDIIREYVERKEKVGRELIELRKN